jgi:hypothetical protein
MGSLVKPHKYLLLPAIVVLASCVGLNSTTVATVQIDAPASLCWSGAIGDATHEGCGTTTINIDSSIGLFAATAQKQSDDKKALTISLIINGKVVDSATTTAGYGIVVVSGSG